MIIIPENNPSNKLETILEKQFNRNYSSIFTDLYQYYDLIKDKIIDLKIDKPNGKDQAILIADESFENIQEKNFMELLEIEYDDFVGNYKEFNRKFFDKILNLDIIQSQMDNVSKFFTHELDYVKVENILYQRKDGLIFLDIRFNMVGDYYVVSIVDITPSIEDKLLLGQLSDDKEVLLKEIHHRVKNNLQILLSLISLQERFNKDPKTIIEFMKLEIGTMATIHNHLYLGDVDTVEISRILNDFRSNYENLYGDLGIIFDLKCMGNIETNINLSNPVFLIMNELVINSINHAFVNHEKDDKIIMCIFEKKEDNLVIYYGDNGNVTRDGSKNNPGGLGHLIIDFLLSQIDGEIDYMYEDSYSVKLTIPLT